MDFQEQAQLHSQIRDALAAAISERQPPAPALLATERLCPTGCWLQGPGARRWAGNHTFLCVSETHRAFHREVDAIAGQIARGQWHDAQKALPQGAALAQALGDLTAALRSMRTAAATLAA